MWWSYLLSILLVCCFMLCGEWFVLSFRRYIFTLEKLELVLPLSLRLRSALKSVQRSSVREHGLLMTRKTASVAGAVLFGSRAAVFIWPLHERLVPDTMRYATGGTWWWSSVVASGFGTGFGYFYVQCVGFVGGCVFGGVVGYISFGRNWPALVAAVFFLPPSLYTMQASADALGAAIVVAAVYSRRPSITLGLLVASFAVHVVAGLCLVVALVGRVLGLRMDGIALLVGGVAACVAMWHLQSRYLLPGTTVVWVIVVRHGLASLFSRWVSSGYSSGTV